MKSFPALQSSTGKGPFGERESESAFGRSRRTPRGPKFISPFGSGYMVHRARGGSVPGYFFGGSSGGGSSGGMSGSQTYRQGTADTQFEVGSEEYNNLMKSVLSGAGNLSNANPQDFIAGFTPDQQQAFQQIRNNQGNWAGNFGQANQALGKAAGYDPFQSGMGFLNQAAGAPTGSQAAAGNLGAASGTWPGAASQYMDPYIQQVVEANNRLSQQNLTENVLPKITDTFTGGAAAQFGREQHADVAGRAIRDNQQALNNTNASALSQGYKTSADIFGTDMSRLANVGNIQGSLATGDRSQFTNMGATAGNLANQAQQGQINIAQGQQNLGKGTQDAAMTDASNLLQSGNQQQALNQQYASFPLQMLQYQQGLSQGWTLPYNTSQQTSSHDSTMGWSQQQQAQPSGSGIGQLLGAGISLGSMFIPGGQVAGPMIGAAVSKAAGQRGGQYPFGKLQAGGYIPSAKGVMQRNAQRQPPQQPMGGPPTGMPGMPPPAPPMPRAPGGASPFARGGQMSDAAQDRRDIRRAVWKHERQMHKARTSELTKLRSGGSFDQGGLFGPAPRVRYGDPRLDAIREDMESDPWGRRDPMDTLRKAPFTGRLWDALDKKLRGQKGYADGGVADRLLDDMGYQGQFLRTPSNADVPPDAPFGLDPAARHARRLQRIDQANNRIAAIDAEARANPGDYWRDLATQVPRGLSSMGELFGIPGTVLEALGQKSEVLPTVEGIDRKLDDVFGMPRTSGGQAGRETGQALLGTLGVGNASKLANAIGWANRLRKAGTNLGDSINLLDSLYSGAR